MFKNLSPSQILDLINSPNYPELFKTNVKSEQISQRPAVLFTSRSDKILNSLNLKYQLGISFDSCLEAPVVEQLLIPIKLFLGI